MIVNFYIEVKDDADQAILESVITGAGFAFYDATAFDRYTTDKSFKTLDEIEADLELK